MVQDLLFDQEPIQVASLDENTFHEHELSLQRIRSSNSDQIDSLLENVQYR